jgi:hypothetical protein
MFSLRAVKCSPIQAFLKPPGVEEPEPVEILLRGAGGVGARSVERHGEVPEAHPSFPLQRAGAFYTDQRVGPSPALFLMYDLVQHHVPLALDDSFDVQFDVAEGGSYREAAAPPGAAPGSPCPGPQDLFAVPGVLAPAPSPTARRAHRLPAPKGRQADRAG